MEKVLFGDIFTKTFKKVFKVPKVIIDDPIFRMHYKFTGLALLFASILVSGYQFFGDPIMCIQKDDIPVRLLNTYCWIEGTFTLPKALFKSVGTEVVYPGVDKFLPGDELVEHTFYQWVCFVLLIQSVMFCFPWFLWKTIEAGRITDLAQKLRNPCPNEEDYKSSFKGLVEFFRSHRFEHKYYATKFLCCEVLNLVNVLLQIYFINLFLGGEFTKYGVNVVKYANEEQENRIDPMIRVFPRITKCTFHKYGSSGDVQRHDALCLLPLNILNEKIYIVMWFWFIILAILDALLLLFRFTAVYSTSFRLYLMTHVTNLTSKKCLKSLIEKISYGDWFLLYFLAGNIEDIHFCKFAVQLYDEGPHSSDLINEEKYRRLNLDALEKISGKAIKSKFSDEDSLNKKQDDVYKEKLELDEVDESGKKTKQEPTKDYDHYGESFA